MTPIDRTDNRIRIIVNPISGRGSGRTIGQQLLDTLKQAGHTADLLVTEQPGDAENWAGDQNGEDVIVSVGGDGTIREIVNGIDLSDPPRLAICPTGTGNVMAGELRLPSVPESLVSIIERGTERWLDVAQYGSQRFLCMAGFGFDASIVNSFHERRGQHTGMGTYVHVGINELLSRRAPLLNVYVDGSPQARHVSFVQVANTRNYGGPLLFSPSARADDGRFDVSWLETTGRPAVFRLMISALVGIPSLNPDFRSVQGRSVRVEPIDDEPKLQLDGDPVKPSGHMFQMHPRAIPFLTPVSRSHSKR